MSDKKLLEEFKILVFEQNQATKQNKDRLFKLAKASNDIETIRKLADQYGFKSAKNYIFKWTNASLEDAIRHQDIILLSNILKNNVDLQNINFNELVIRKYKSDFLIILMNNGLDVGQVNIAELVRNGYNLDIIKLAVKLGSDINARMIASHYRIPYSSLHLIAQEFYDISIAQFLIEKGIDLELKASGALGGEITALNLAADFGNTELVELLIQHDTNIEGLDNINNSTPLIKAVQKQHPEIVKLLLIKANINAKMDEGWTALHVATNNGDIELVKLLIEKKANLNQQLDDGASALILASANGNLEIVNLLIRFHANLNFRLRNRDGMNALMIAIKKKNFDIAETLIVNNAEVNYYTYGMYETAFTMSVMVRNYKLAKLLLDHGARVNHLMKGFLSILDFAMIQQSDAETLNFLNENGAKKCYVSGHNDTITPAKEADLDMVLEDTYHKTKMAITSPFLAEQFILEALDACSKTDYPKAQKFVDESGYKKYEYENRMDQNFSFPEVDGPGGPQQVLAFECLFQLGVVENRELVADMSMKINDMIMKDYSLGRYKIKIIKLTILENDKHSHLYIYPDYLIFDRLTYNLILDEKYYNQKTQSYIIVHDNRIDYWSRNRGSDEKETIKTLEITNRDIVYEHNLKTSTYHEPKSLINILKNFTIDKPMKYTTHAWDFGDLKKEYGGFTGYMEAVRVQWDAIKDELEQLSPNLYQKIYNFLWEKDDKKALGWFSVQGLKEWCNNGNDPFTCPIDGVTFGEIKDAFKNVIEIRKEQDKLEDVFIQERKKLGRGFKVETIKLKGKTFYTDVEKFKSAISKIFVQNALYGKDKEGTIVYTNIKAEAIEDEHNRYLEIHIAHIDSFAYSSKKDMVTEADDGDFADIKMSLQNLCDWSIQNSYEGENYQINYLRNGLTEETEKLHFKPEGFTHILRFYNK